MEFYAWFHIFGWLPAVLCMISINVVLKKIIYPRFQTTGYLRRGCWVPQCLSICWVDCSVWLLDICVEQLNSNMQNNSGKLKVHEIWDFKSFYPTSISMLSLKDSGDTSEIGLGYSHFQQPISFHSKFCHMKLKHSLTVKKWPYLDNFWGLIKK